MNSDRSPANRSHPDVTQGQVAEDFDRIVDDYEEKINSAIAFGGREHRFYIDVKREKILDLASEHFPTIADLDVLDLGCGVGAYHPGLEGKFRELHGIDVSSRSIAAAKQKHDFVVYETFDGERLPYPDGRFDLAFAICVMHHVPPKQWLGFCAEMFRVLKPGGLALIFEHNPYNPATQYIVKTCDIDKDAVLLRPRTVRKLFAGAGFEEVYTRTILSVPPVGSFLTLLDRGFGYLPLGAQYYMSAAKPRRA